MTSLPPLRNDAPLCVYTPVQPGTDAPPRGLWRDPDSAWPRRLSAAALLVWLGTAAGLAGAIGVPTANAQNLGSVDLGSSQSLSVTVTIGTAGTVGSIVASTQGIPSLDFASDAGGTCQVGDAFTVSQTCIVNVSFAPVEPGLREGAVQLKSSGGTVLGAAYVYGTGVGSLLRYNPGTEETLYSSLNQPQAMVVDAGSNIYIADTQNGVLRKFVWTGSSYNAPVDVGTWTQPTGVAVDGAGNLFVTDQSTNKLSKVPWTGSGYGTQVVVSSAYSAPQDVAVDGSGNLYILSSATTISKLPWNGTGYGTAVTIGSGFSGSEYNTDVVDNSGNIYVADCNNGTVTKESYNGSTYTQTRLLNYGTSNCIDGVAVDPAGDVYVADFDSGTNGVVQLLPFTGTGYGSPVTLSTTVALEGPEAIYLDGVGNVYIEDFTLNFVEKWSVTALPTITFPTHTNVGSEDTTDNPRSVSLLNIGNAPLSILPPDTGLNPAFSSGFIYANSSTCPQLTPSSGAETLDSGASCTYAVDFAPTSAGTISGSFVLTDNYNGASSTTQTIFLSGTGVSTVTKLAFGSSPATPIGIGGNAGSAVTVDEELNSSAIDTYGNDVITLTVTGPGSYSKVYTQAASSGVATFNLASVALNTAGTYTYTASLTSVTSAVASETVNNLTSQTITGFAPATPVTYGVAPITLTATGGGSGNPVTFRIVSGPGTLNGTNNSTLTVTGSGTIVIAANQAGNVSYAAAAQVTATTAVNSAVVATQAIASTTLTVNHAATPFTPVTGSGGTAPLNYGVSPALPTGLSMSTSTGAITGTPAVTISASTYTVTVKDANNATATAIFSLTVNSAVAAMQAIASTSLTVNHAATSFTPVTGSGGTAPLSYSVLPALPTGLAMSISTGAITGTPTVTSSASSYTVTVKDANNATATATFSVTVNIAVVATQSIANTNLTVNHAATPFTPVTGSGGTAPLSYSVSPTLPTGLSVSPATGAITGTPAVASAASTYTVTVTDVNGAIATATFSLTVKSAVIATQAIASANLTENHAATSFTPVTGSGGTGTLSYGVSPTLPTGLTMSSSTGAITGTPTVTSTTTTYTVTVTDANSATATATFSLTVNNVVAATQAVATTTLSSNIAATPFTPITGSGGTAPLSYGVSPTLPAGLSMSSSTGAITGTPTTTSSATTYTVTVTDANSTTATATFSLAVASSSQTIIFTPSTPVTYGISPITLIATGGASGNPVTFSIVLGPGTLSGTNNSTLTVTGAGTILIAANQAGNASYSAATQVTASIVVNQKAQAITFTPSTPVTYGASPITLTATGGASGNPVIFSIVSGPGTLSGTNNSTLTVTGAGTIVIAANQAGNASYSAATQVTASIVVNQATQAITFSPATPVTYGVSPITLTATGGASGNPVIFSIVSGPGTLSGTNNSTLTVTGAGTIVIAANQAGNASYSAATQVTASIVVNQATQAITAFSPSTPVTYGVLPITLTATGGASGDPVTFSIISGPGTLSGTNNSTLTVTGAGTIVIAANQAGNVSYSAATQVIASIVVNQATQAIIFSPATPVTYGVSPITLAATGGASGNPVIFSIVSGPGTLSGANNSTLTVSGAGTIVIAANQAGNASYSAATQVIASIVVNQTSQLMTFSPATPVTYGVSPITLTATGGASGNPVIFSIVSGPGTLSGADNATLTATGAGTIAIAANQAGNASYSAATQVTASIVVNKASLTVTVNPVISVYGVAFPTFTGTVTGVVSGDGITATYSTTATPTSAVGGTYSIVATLVDPNSRLGNYSVTNTPAALTITRGPALVGLVSSANPVFVLNPVMLTATITGATVPTGSVNFLDGATPLGTAAVANGMATLAVTTLAVGTHSIAAVYSGDTNFAAATSATLINEVVQDFSLAISASGGNGSVTALPGGTAAYNFTVSPVNGTTFPATITLSASGLPSGAMYVFSPASLVAGSGSTNVTLTVQLPPSTFAAESAEKHDSNPARRLAPFALALLLLPFAGRMRKVGMRMSWYVILLMAVGFSAMAGLTGCGTNGSGYFAQSPQTYTVTVTGTSGLLSHSTSVTLTVK